MLNQLLANDLPSKALTIIMTLANRIAIMCTRVSFIAMGDMSIGIMARLVTAIVTFRSVSKIKIGKKNIERFLSQKRK